MPRQLGGGGILAQLPRPLPLLAIGLVCLWGWQSLQPPLLVPDFLLPSLTTFSRILLGITLPVPLALLLGVVAGLKPNVDRLLLPLLMAFGTLPGFFWGPLLLLLLGPTSLAVIMAIAINSTFIEFELVRSGVKEIPNNLLQIAKSLGVRGRLALTGILLPPILPRLVESFRICLATMWDNIMAAELLANVAGLGSFIYASKQAANPLALVAGVATIMLFTVLLEKLILGRAESRLTRWRR